MRESARPAALVIGAGGGIGRAVTSALLAAPGLARVHAVSRRDAPPGEAPEGLQWHVCDHAEASIEGVVQRIAQAGDELARVVICTGLLHRGDLQPEKAIERLRRDRLLEVLEVNAVVPALWLGALTGLVREARAPVVAAISARVGSIADNRLGGWYSYRASKAALNMLLKTASVEWARRAPRAKLIAFHPGTTDTGLSRPFQARVPADRLFTPGFVAGRLLAIMDEARADGELDFIDWAGEPVPW